MVTRRRRSKPAGEGQETSAPESDVVAASPAASSGDETNPTSAEQTVNEAAPSAAAQAEIMTTSTINVESTPIVVEAEHKKKKKRKYTSSAGKRAHSVERGATSGVRRLAKSLTKGITRWRDRSDTSSRKKRDGAIKDGLKNHTRSMQKAVDGVSKAPRKFVKRLPKSIRSPSPSKLLGRIVPLAGPPSPMRLLLGR